MWKKTRSKEVSVHRSSETKLVIILNISPRSASIQMLTQNTFPAPAGDNECGSESRLGCSHLCLPTGRLDGRCACPSTGGLVLGADDKTCVSKWLLWVVHECQMTPTTPLFNSDLETTSLQKSLVNSLAMFRTELHFQTTQNRLRLCCTPWPTRERLDSFLPTPHQLALVSNST